MKHTCDGSVWTPGAFRSRRCGSGAKYEHEGKHYCKVHHPPTVEAKKAARQQAWREEYYRKQEALKAEIAERKEAKRRADLFPELLEALKLAYNAMSGSTDKTILVRAHKAAGVAIAKATGSAP